MKIIQRTGEAVDIPRCKVWIRIPVKGRFLGLLTFKWDGERHWFIGFWSG